MAAPSMEALIRTGGGDTGTGPGAAAAAPDVNGTAKPGVPAA
jgi:hypothetical protein